MMKSSLSAAVFGMLVFASSNTNAFQPRPFQQSRIIPSTARAIATTTTCLAMAKKKALSTSGKAKGFGTETSAPVTKKKTTESTSSTSTSTFSPMAMKPEPTTLQGMAALPNTVMEQSDRTEENPLLQSAATSSSSSSSGSNQGQLALERMRREQAEKKDAELRRVKEIRDTDKLLQTSPAAAAIPEKVAMRMGQRMLPFVGIPLFGSMGAFVAFWYFATYKNVEFEPGMVAATTIVILVSGLLGITYSIVSASWDEDREGSFLGVEEFQRNVGSIKEGLDRSKENLVLREKMAGLPEAEIEAAIKDLERREQRQQQSLINKLNE